MGRWGKASGEKTNGNNNVLFRVRCKAAVVLLPMQTINARLSPKPPSYPPTHPLTRWFFNIFLLSWIFCLHSDITQILTSIIAKQSWWNSMNFTAGEPKKRATLEDSLKYYYYYYFIFDINKINWNLLIIKYR